MTDPASNISHSNNKYQDFPGSSNTEPQLPYAEALAPYTRKRLVAASQKPGWLTDRASILLLYYDPGGRHVGYQARTTVGSQRWTPQTGSGDAL